MAANFTNVGALTGEGGKLADPEGKKVGSWKVRSHLPVTCDDPSVSLLLSHGDVRGSQLSPSGDSDDERDLDKSQKEAGATYRSKRRSRHVASAMPSESGEKKTVGYGPEQVVTNLRYRFGPNYAITRRVLMEVRSLLGGVTEKENGCFRPRRVLDFGCGVGSSSAAALDVFGVPRSNNVEKRSENGIEWIHSIDVSRSMRDATEHVLKSVLEGVPWGYDESQTAQEETEMDEDDKMLLEIRGGVNEKALERRRKRLQKWEQSWEKLTDYRTRLTFGESIVDSSSFYSQLSHNRDEQTERPDLPWQKQLDEQRQQLREKRQKQPNQSGSFDLILCTYTLSEISGVSSTLTAAALLWEKLSPGGVMVFVEPGTPDGFSTLRSVRSMLIECFPPKEIRDLRYKEEKKALMEKLASEEDDTKQEALRLDLEMLEKGLDEWEEECQVIAPCTHNGLCPMSRHQKNHIKKNTRFGKYDVGSETDEIDDSVGVASDGSQDEIGYDIIENNSQLAEADEEEKLFQELIEQGYDKEQLEEMMQLMGSLEDDDDTSDDSDNEFDPEDEDDFVEMDMENEINSRSKSTMSETDVFETAFCSFVHSFPGGTTRKKGEKCTYLVVQKQTPSLGSEQNYSDPDSDDLQRTDIVDLLAKSAYHVQGLRQELISKAKRARISNSGRSEDLNETSLHANELRAILDEAVKIEDQFLDSDRDKLGMELVHGKERRKGWGRLSRAPIKKRGHILVDYCSGGCTGCSELDGTQGRIIRQKVSRAWSKKVAPGCYAAARKSRWGGLWPDLSQRVP